MSGLAPGVQHGVSSTPPPLSTGPSPPQHPYGSLPPQQLQQPAPGSHYQQHQGSTTQRQRRRCAEVCVELLCYETAKLFVQREDGPSAAAALEAIGFRVGRQLAERVSRDRPGRLGDTLDVMKFVCKEFWTSLYKKQVDGLKTNHRPSCLAVCTVVWDDGTQGTYVLQDNSFRWLLRVQDAGGPTEPDPGDTLDRAARLYLRLPCGILRGALTHLGVICTVEAEVKALPSCSFTIKINS